MNQSGDAAEQIVRLSLEGIEVAARITGNAAKEIAVFLAVALKNKDKNLKLKGKTRMASMLKSGKPLEIFSVREIDIKKFMQGAKQYGIVYCALRNRNSTPDGLCDILVKADDAPKISRLVERFKFATVDRAKIESEITRSRTEKAKSSEPVVSEKARTEKLLDSLLGTTEAVPGNSRPNANPRMAKTEKSLLSEPTSENKSESGDKGIMNDKPSVREEIREIKARKAKAESGISGRDNYSIPKRQNTIDVTPHIQPQTASRRKPQKPKGR